MSMRDKGFFLNCEAAVCSNTKGMHLSDSIHQAKGKVTVSQVCSAANRVPKLLSVIVIGAVALPPARAA